MPDGSVNQSESFVISTRLKRMFRSVAFLDKDRTILNKQLKSNMSVIK